MEKPEKEIKKSPRQIAKEREIVKDRALVCEKRLLLFAFACGVLGTVLFFIGFASEFWVYVQFQSPQSREEIGRGKFLKTGHYHGLWRICREELWAVNENSTNETYPYLYCRQMYFALPPTVKPETRDLETKMMDFRRSTVAVGFIAIFLSIMAHCFTWYSLGHLRYMFKRLAGCLHLITGASCWVVLEVFRQSVLYEERNMKHYVPEFSNIKYGWSYNLVWIAFIAFPIPGVILLACSRKRKGRKARSWKEASENEPVHLGRI